MTWLYALGVVVCLIWAAVIITWPQPRPGPRLRSVRGGKETRQRRRAQERRRMWDMLRMLNGTAPRLGERWGKTGRRMRRDIALTAAKG